MTRGRLLAAIGAAALAVVALAVLTPTVIVGGDRDRGGVRVQAVAPPGWTPYGPVPNGPRGGLLQCLRQHGLTLPPQGSPPTMQTMRDAMKACLAQLPGDRYRP